MEIWKILPSESLIGTLCSVVPSLLLVYFVAFAVYQLLISPLRAVPGPWYAAVSDFWLITHVLRFRRCRAINDALLKYGSIVRIAPNKVVFLDAPTMKSVYGISSRLSKSAFYKCLLTNENDHAMTTLDHGAHQVRKKGYAPHYNPANVALFQPDIHDFTTEVVELLKTVANHKPLSSLDTLLLFRHFTIDVNCTHLFGCKIGSLKAWSHQVMSSGPSDTLSDAISDFPKRGLIRSALPVWFWNIIQRIPNERWKKFCDSDSLLGRFVGERVRETRSLLHSGRIRVDEDGKMPLLMRLLSHKYSEQEPMPDNDIVSEGIGHLVAGSDTTTTTLSYLLWELSRRRDIILKLQSELDECMLDPSRIPDIQVLQGLPYLNAVIKEGLRVYTAAPSPLERVAPVSEGESFVLLGYTIPAGTIISSQAWSSHRHPDVFFCPDMFLPERWLLTDPPLLDKHSFCAISKSIGEKDMSAHLGPSLSAYSDREKGGHCAANTKTSQAQMSAHMFPFGHGPRVCGGQNMAQMILRIVLATIIRNFNVIAPPETNERSMAIKDSFVVFPAAMECKLIFVPRPN
ncbi:hypothetical protein M0805_002016 [Coniferiporia weirii]|nr:hypothetical protein M0805_002016 [Coniferiporia weirii]